MNFCFAFAILVMFISACSAVDEPSPKEFGSEPGYLITKGLYDIDYEFGESNCEPHVNTIRYSGDPSWPAKVSVFRRPPAFPETYISMTFANIRGQSMGGSINIDLDLDGTSFTKSLETYDEYIVEQVECIDGSKMDLSGKTTQTAYSIADNVVKLNVTNTFDLSEECEGVRPQGEFWFPRDSCTESYVATYTLREACPSNCTVDRPWKDVESPEGAFYRTMDETQEWCICPE